MNRKGQTVMVGIMIAVMAYIMIVQFVSPLKSFITDARAPAGLDCTNSSITDGEKSTCVIVDFSLFYFIGMAIAVAVGGIGGYALKKL